MKEVTKQNHKRMRQEFINRKNIAKKQKSKENILTIFVTTFIVLVTILILSMYSKETINGVKKCMQKGYSENYCQTHL